MGDWSVVEKLIGNLGSTGLLLLVLWKLLDKHAGRFLAAQENQARAMGDLAAAVREGAGDQREVLLAVRVMANELEQMKEWIKELANRGGPAR